MSDRSSGVLFVSVSFPQTSDCFLISEVLFAFASVDVSVLLDQAVKRLYERPHSRYWKVTAEMKRVESLLNLDLDLSLPRLLRYCLGQGAFLGKEAVVAASGRASEKSDCFSSLLKVRFAISLAGNDSEGLLIYSICAQCRPVSSFKFLEKMNGEAEATCICAEAYISIEGRATQHGKDPAMAILIRALSNVTFDECKGLLEMGDKKQARSFFN